MRRFAYYVPILGYHRVGPGKGDHVPTVSPEAFERQMRFLARHRYHVVTLDAVARGLEGGEPLSRRSVAITFDDGYEETHTIVWPILKRFGFPAAVFVTPMEVSRRGFLTWPQIRQMAQDGVQIGSHTMHHTYLPLVKPQDLAEELAGSKRAIEEQIGQPVRFISYPVGGFTSQVQALARQAGYAAACTTNRCAPEQAVDLFALRRIKVTELDANPVAFWVKVSGHYDSFRRLKAPS